MEDALNLNDRFLQFALLGSSWVLWILVGLSVLCVAAGVERYRHYRRAVKNQRVLHLEAARVWAAAQRGDSADALESLKTHVKGAGGPTARMLRGTFEARSAGRDAMQSIHDAYRTAEKLRLERHLNILGTVGANAPFIGLFGTVLEILRVFHVIGDKGLTSSDHALEIMSGISEALVATAIGLLVAIPAVVAYNSLVRWMDNILGSADEVCQIVRASISASTGGSNDGR